MAGNYFANKRRREAQKGKPVVTNTLRRIEFHVDGVPYVYEYRTDSRSGFSYIYKGNEKIFGPYDHECTEEGRRIDQLITEHKLHSQIP